jgi:hypothetical protein
VDALFHPVWGDPQGIVFYDRPKRDSPSAERKQGNLLLSRLPLCFKKVLIREALGTRFEIPFREKKTN